MSAKRTLLRLAPVLFLFAAFSADGIAAPVGEGSPFDALLRLDTPAHTGGLTREDRAVATRIHDIMARRYTAVCPEPRIGSEIADPPQEPDVPQRLPTIADPHLAALVAAAHNPSREVRDVAIYTIALLGPSARPALAIIEDHARAHRQDSGWYVFLRAQVACDHDDNPDFRSVIAGGLLPPHTSYAVSAPPEFLRPALIVLAKLYLDPNVEYPPETMGFAYVRESVRDRSELSPVDLLVQILDDDRLSLQKRREAAEALMNTRLEYLAPARQALERAALHSTDAKTRSYVARPLAEWEDEAAIPALAGYADDPEDPTWKRYLCTFGHAAIGVQDRLIAVAAHTAISNIRIPAVQTLGCIGSAKALPLLTAMLKAPDWTLNVAAAEAIGDIGDADPRALAILRDLADRHWSGIVRDAAANARDRLSPGYVPKPPEQKTGPDIETLFLGGIMGPFDHGLPYCDPAGRYSLDGKSWFDAKWHNPGHQPVPPGFRGMRLVQGAGQQSFLRVADGWLMGSDGFESEGVLVHVSDTGVITDLDRGVSIEGIVKVGGRYFAYGYNLLRAGWAGALKQITRTADGHWQARDVVTLPSVAFAHAIAPGGKLLLSDGANTYAVLGERIVPLKCEKTHAEGYAFGAMSDPRYWRD